MMQVILQESHNSGILAAMKKQLGRPAPAVDVATFYAAFGKVLAGARNKVLLSQAGLAEGLGISQPTIGKIETGRHFPRIKTCLKIKYVLGVPFYELFRLAVEKGGDAVLPSPAGGVELAIRRLAPEKRELVQYIMDASPEHRHIADVVVGVFKALTSGGRKWAGVVTGFTDTGRIGRRFKPRRMRNGKSHSVSAANKRGRAPNQDAPGSATQGKKR